MSRSLQWLPIPCGQGGLYRSVNFKSVPPTELLIAANVSTRNGFWGKPVGMTSVWDAGSTIRGLYGILSSMGSGLIAHTVDGLLRHRDISSGVITTIESGLTATTRMTMITGHNGSSPRLFRFNQGYQVGVASSIGTGSMGVLTTPAADWSGTLNYPFGACLHNGKMFAWGNNNYPHRLYYAPATNNEDFAGAGSGTYNVFPGQGQYIAAATSFRGRLFIFKYPQGIYWLDEDAGILRCLTNAIGMSSHGGIVDLENDKAFHGSDGYQYLLSATDDTLGNVSASRWFSDRINQISAGFLTVSSIYHPRLQIWIFGGNTSIPMAEFTGQSWRSTLQQVATIAHATLGPNSSGEPTVYSNIGSMIYSLFTGTVPLGTSDVSTHEIEPQANSVVNLSVLRVTYRHTDAFSLSFTIYNDGVSETTATLSEASSGGGIYKTKDIPLTGTARRVRVRFTDDGATPTWEIAEMALGFTSGADRAY